MDDATFTTIHAKMAEAWLRDTHFGGKLPGNLDYDAAGKIQLVKDVHAALEIPQIAAKIKDLPLDQQVAFIQQAHVQDVKEDPRFQARAKDMDPQAAEQEAAQLAHPLASDRAALDTIVRRAHIDDDQLKQPPQPVAPPPPPPPPPPPTKPAKARLPTAAGPSTPAGPFLPPDHIGKAELPAEDDDQEILAARFRRILKRGK
jgi:hypothetical protein